MEVSRPTVVGPRRTLGLITAVVVIGCGGGARTDAWSVRIHNPGSDFIVRFTSDADTTYAQLPQGGEGLVSAGEGRIPAGASIAVLDPVSCRVVSLIEELPAGHAYISTSWGGTLLADTYDPDDYGGTADHSDQLRATDTCAESDAAAKPRPLPTRVAGEWLNGWEMYCEATNNGAPFGVRGEFLLGAAMGCDARPGHSGGAVSDQRDVALWSVDNDWSRLGLTWSDTACANGATISLVPTFGRYNLHVISTAAECAPTMQPYSAVLYLTESIDVRLVDASVERLVD